MEENSKLKKQLQELLSKSKPTTPTAKPITPKSINTISYNIEDQNNTKG